MNATPALLQLTSPTLPIGAFSYSSGLECAIELGWVHDATSCQRWIGDQLHETALRWDAPLWAALFDAWNDEPANVASLNEEAIAARETLELRNEHTQMGHALRRWICDVLAPEVPTAQLAILRALDEVSFLTAHALAAQAMNLSKEAGIVSYCFGFVENQVMAASKAVPLGQTDAQKMLRAITQSLQAEVAGALSLPRQAWSSAAPLVAIASMRHETQYTRLFRS